MLIMIEAVFLTFIDQLLDGVFILALFSILRNVKGKIESPVLLWKHNVMLCLLLVLIIDWVLNLQLPYVIQVNFCKLSLSP